MARKSRWRCRTITIRYASGISGSAVYIITMNPKNEVFLSGRDSIRAVTARVCEILPFENESSSGAGLKGYPVRERALPFDGGRSFRWCEEILATDGHRFTQII